MHERLIIIRDGRSREVSIQALRHGADGNVQTLRYAAEMVRAAAADDWLRDLAASLVAECTPHDAQCEISKVFEFVRDRVRFVDDPPGHERLADARTTLMMPSPAADCLGKAVLLMSLLATIGYLSQFIVQEWEGDVDENGFDHVHPEIILADGSALQADATERSGVLGYEKPSVGRMRFEVWQGVGRQELSGIWDQIAPSLINTGVQFGASFAQGQIQQSRQNSASSEAEKPINAQWEILVSQALSVFKSISAKMPNVTAADLETAAQWYQALDSYSQQYPTGYILDQWNSDAYRGAAIHDLNLYHAALTAPAVIGQPSSVISPSVLSSPWTLAALAVGALLLLRK